MGEDICNWYVWQGVNKELIKLNIKKPHKQPNLKMDRRPEQTVFQRRYTNNQQAHEKMLNITNHQGNASQNHNELSPHTS